MTRSTIQKRLSKFTGSKSSVAYKIVKDLSTGENKSYRIFGSYIRPVYTSGKGKYTSNLDYTKDVCSILDLIKIKYEVGNDSPRGGLTGNFIKIKTSIK